MEHKTGLWTLSGLAFGHPAGSLAKGQSGEVLKACFAFGGRRAILRLYDYTWQLLCSE